MKIGNLIKFKVAIYSEDGIELLAAPGALGRLIAKDEDSCLYVVRVYPHYSHTLVGSDEFELVPPN